jgi:DNA polymerase (family 10)
MPVVNATIAGIFDEIADLLDIQGANPFRIRAYRNAARTIGELGADLKTLMERGTALTDIPGIGEDLSN